MQGDVSTMTDDFVLSSDITSSDDYFGSWNLHSFYSKDAILSHTVLLASVERKTALGTEKQEFRHYRNKYGYDRILMLNSNTENQDKDEYTANITNGVFFGTFCDSMMKYGEITEDEFKNINSSMDRLGIKYNSDENEHTLIDRLSEQEIEELNNL